MFIFIYASVGAHHTNLNEYSRILSSGKNLAQRLNTFRQMMCERFMQIFARVPVHVEVARQTNVKLSRHISLSSEPLELKSILLCGVDTCLVGFPMSDPKMCDIQ